MELKASLDGKDLLYSRLSLARAWSNTTVRNSQPLVLDVLLMLHGSTSDQSTCMRQSDSLPSHLSNHTSPVYGLFTRQMCLIHPKHLGKTSICCARLTTNHIVPTHHTYVCLQQNIRLLLLLKKKRNLYGLIINLNTLKKKSHTTQDKIPIKPAHRTALAHNKDFFPKHKTRLETGRGGFKSTTGREVFGSPLLQAC